MNGPVLLCKHNHRTQASSQLTFSVPDPPGWVKVKRQSDEAAEVQWSPSESKKPGIVRGYRVTYTPLGGNKRPITSKEKVGGK